MFKSEAYEPNMYSSANQQHSDQHSQNQGQQQPSHGYQFASAHPAQQQASSHGNSFKGQLLLLIIASVIVTALTFSLAAMYPNKMKELVLSVDQFGITDAGASEQARVRAIHAMPITYEEKQVLINRTVFLGASTEMVGLALGNPICVQNSAATQDVPATQHWVYFIEGDPKPTRLAFQENRLVSASKPSAMDICK